MQENSFSVAQNVHFESNNGLNQQDHSVYSNSTFSDSGSWDTDFDDEGNSESSGLYGDATCDSEGKLTGSTSHGRVAALAKTVAASLAASGSQGAVKATKPLHKPTEFLSKQVNNCENGRNSTSSYNISPNSVKNTASKTLPKPPIPLRPSISQSSTCKLVDEEKKGSSYRSNYSSSHSMSNSSLPKPPGPTSEQVQQVIGALGHLWPSDSISLSSQTQSDDDYEPIQSDSSPLMDRLKSHTSFKSLEYTSKALRNASLNPGNSSLSIPEVHSTQEYCDNTVPQSTPFLHSPAAAAAALAVAAASAAATRMAQVSKRSNSLESNAYSPSSGSSLSEHSSNSILPGHQEGVYEPIEEKRNKVSMPVQKSYLHSAEKSEKLEVKRGPTAQQEQRPPVPNRPLPPTPKPSADHVRGGSLVAGLENQPWFHNVDRKQAEQLIKNGPDGYFLIRPSSQSQNPLTLTLLFNERVYNISVRQRKDGRIALGFEKPDEQSFDTIEEMVSNYHSENLLLFSRNERTGRTVLTKSPPKQRHT